ncbi:hypothetical protein [Actinophytocola sp.]|uniref:hypothetical protein n=1 Tax=Actinophytocola sp. TaxID=1872138 RepID=UPI002D7F0F71|nr:hypothetical protein [Actinophytocola sp.]HET9143100.1 hypothetical protein [Actinophytocola sp.]
MTDTVDLESFVVEGRFGTIGLDATPEQVVEAFGAADHLEPYRRSTPMTLLYGDDLEFRFHRRHLTAVSLGLPDHGPPGTGPIDTTGLWPPDRRAMATVRSRLAAAGVSWRLDPIMTKLYDGDDSQAWVTENGVHLSFFEGLLGRIVLSDLVTTPG